MTKHSMYDGPFTGGKDEDRVAHDIVEKEAWLRSFGMAPYTSPSDYNISKVNKKRAESLKKTNSMFSSPPAARIVLTEDAAQNLPACEKIPGVLSAGFKHHLEGLKQDCLTSVNWNGACSQVSYAIKQHTIGKVVILGSASIFSHTGEYIFWQHEMGFVLAIFELAKQQAQSKKTRTPKLYFQDPSFCAADHRLLQDLGGQVIQDPEAFMRYIDEKTLVFAKCPPLTMYFQDLLQTRPAVCISADLKQTIDGALYLQSKYSDFPPNFDIRGTAEAFMIGRQKAELHQAMHHLYPSIPDRGLDNFLVNMWVYWQGEKVDATREAKKVGKLGNKAKKWLESL
ncbi:hypothetical protein D6D06_09903 [Aureobasidium pullulans]|nr:hypothetical protein D6D06_09903 [Aureobasidium pullulans]